MQPLEMSRQTLPPSQLVLGLIGGRMAARSSGHIPWPVGTWCGKSVLVVSLHDVQVRDQIPWILAIAWLAVTGSGESGEAGQ